MKEGKILETAEGKLSFYSSWNDFGCIVYSVSSDNGKTWGPIVKMELAMHVCAESMQKT